MGRKFDHAVNGQDMDVRVADVVAQLRGAHGETLRALEAEHTGYAQGTIPRRSSRIFAPLVASRKRALGSASQHPKRNSEQWRDILLAVFRRYAGDLVVQGKLLNHDELLVRRIVRVGSGGPGSDANVVIVSIPEAVVRFIVQCDDAETAQIGSEGVTAKVIKPHLRSFLPSSTPTALCANADGYTSLFATGSVVEKTLEELDTLYGFDIAGFVHRSAAASRYENGDWDDEERGECANAAIARDSSFSDLRGAQRMLNAFAIPPQSWPTFLDDTGIITKWVNMNEADPRSHVSLGKAQKSLWSNDRVSRGVDLRRRGRLKDAVLEYASAINLDDGNTIALMRRGEAYFELRRYEDAIRDLERALQLDPTLEKAEDLAMSARGKLKHSKHVNSINAAGFTTMPVEGLDKEASNRTHTKPLHVKQPLDAKQAPYQVVAAVKAKESGTLEPSRLRQLLEDEERKDAQKKRRQAQRYSSDSDSSSSDRASRRKSGKHKKKHKSKKKKSKFDRDDDVNWRSSKSKKTRKNRHRDSRSHSPSLGSSPSKCDIVKGRRDRRSRSRSYSHSRSIRQVADNLRTAEMAGDLPPILSRQQHRLWN